MRLRFEPRLRQELVLDEARRDLAFRERCRTCLEPIYDLPEEERAGRFAHAYTDLFEERRLGERVETVLHEFPALESRIQEVLVWQALAQREEAVELSADRIRMALCLRLHRLAGGTQLAAGLRHDLMRIADLLDDAFGYRSEPVGASPAEEAAIRERYRLLWDVSIDSRLLRSGRAIEANREERCRDFERTFSFLPVRERRAAFEALWWAEGVTHDQLLRWAGNPVLLLAELAGGLGAETGPAAPVPGTLCPLCRFPTYAWADPSSEAVSLIQADFPNWISEEGLCERCGECYRLIAGRHAG